MTVGVPEALHLNTLRAPASTLLTAVAQLVDPAAAGIAANSKRAVLIAIVLRRPKIEVIATLSVRLSAGPSSDHAPRVRYSRA
jgi:hypothetical protein